MTHGRIAIAALVLGPSLLSTARAEPPAAGSPESVQPPARIIVAPAAAPTLDPVRPNLPPTSAADLNLSTNPPLMREGAFISSARAQMVRGKSGRLYAIFDADAQGRRLPPMIMAESAHLAAMERMLEREPEGARVRLFGRVTVYRDRNFLITTAPAMLERFATADAESERMTASEHAAAKASMNAPAAKSPTSSPSGTPKSPNADPSIEQIVAELDKAVGTRRTLPSAGKPTEPAHSQAGQPSVVDAPSTDGGTTAGFLTSRRARIVRLPDGMLAATLDTGTAGKTDAPFVLLPNQNLTALEATFEQLGDAITISLTGDVFVYKGRRYLLASMYSVNRAADNVMPMQ